MAKHSTNYYESFITVSEDCKNRNARAPEKAGSIAAMQFDALMDAPFALTSDELIWQIERARKPQTVDFDDYYAVGRPCLRTSPLVKTYGWGIYSDAEGRVELVGFGTDRYEALLADDAVTKIKGMKSSR